jgi:tRNA(Ile)-lysidine synthase
LGSRCLFLFTRCASPPLYFRRRTLLPFANVAITLPNRLLLSLEKWRWLRPGDRVGVAVSGGADSMALLLLLVELHKRLGIVLGVVHFNHQLRGRSSDADERAVAKLAKRLGLPFHSSREDIKARSKREKSNLEDCARRARYEFFAQLVTQKHLDKIAVAHTADDQAETVLAHLLRGSGLAGLGGIHPVAGHIVRPLLEFRRPELRAYLRGKKQTWREDATNRDSARTRARIRKKLLPLLEKQFQPRIVQRLSTLSNLVRDDETFLEIFAEARLNTLLADTHRNAGAELNSDWLKISSGELIDSARTHPAIARRMVRLIAKRVKPRAGQLGAEHVNAILSLADHGENGKRLLLPGGLEVLREHDAMMFRPTPRSQSSQTSRIVEFTRTIDITDGESRISIPQLSCVFRLRVIDWPSDTGDTIDKRSVLDRDALRLPLVLRSWRPGDRLQPLGHHHAHKLKHFLSKMRIAGEQRRGWPVLACGERIAWCRGLPVAANFAVNERTRKGLVISEEKAS